MDPFSLFVTNLTTTGRYLELKSTRLNFLVGNDLKNKDATDALFNVGVDQYWWYKASNKSLYLNANVYELWYLSNDKLAIRFVISDVTTGTKRRY